MIGVLSGGLGISVSSSSQTYVGKYGSHAGQVHYNTDSQSLQVYDGQNWIDIAKDYVTIQVDDDVRTVLDWAQRKMREERELEQLAKQYPVLEDAMRDLEVIKTLVKGKRNHDIQQS